MKLALIILVLMCSTAFADNLARIEELKKEGEALIVQRTQVLEQVKSLESRIIEINGALKELTLQDNKKDELKPIAP